MTHAKQWVPVPIGGFTMDAVNVSVNIVETLDQTYLAADHVRLLMGINKNCKTLHSFTCFELTAMSRLSLRQNM